MAIKVRVQVSPRFFYLESSAKLCQAFSLTRSQSFQHTPEVSIVIFTDKDRGLDRPGKLPKIILESSRSGTKSQDS